MRKRNVILGLFAFMMFAVTLFNVTEVKAATDTYGRTYNTWMQIDDNILFTSRERYFYNGVRTIDISFDEWNSSICTSSSDSSLVTINLYNNSTKRTVAYKTLGSHLYTCNMANFGTFNAGYYIHYFLTFDSNQNAYCGYKSNSVIMKSA